MNKNCFIVMGYGKKKDPDTNKMYDLDKTYNNIIKPVLNKLGFEYSRSDDARYSGQIESYMYEKLLTSELVIADISLLNPNALYELGVRHALRKANTIILSTILKKSPFDLRNIKIEFYNHGGNSIDYDEVMRMQGLLEENINQILLTGNTDSPVYTFIPELNPPYLSAIPISVQEEKQIPISFTELRESAENFIRNQSYGEAIAILNDLTQAFPESDYLVQRLAFATYKSESPDKKTALLNAGNILEKLNPDSTINTETLGLSGSIQKRLFDLTAKKEHLDKSLWYYLRGFMVAQDYYTGVNAAFLYDYLSLLEENYQYANSAKVQAEFIRGKVIDSCLAILQESNSEKREDLIWIYLTLAECYFGLGKDSNEQEYYNKAVLLNPSKHAFETYLEQKKKISEIKTIYKSKWKQDSSNW